MKSAFVRVICVLLVISFMVSATTIGVYASEPSSSDELGVDETVNEVVESNVGNFSASATPEEVAAGLASPEMLYRKLLRSGVGAVEVSAMAVGATQLLSDGVYYLINAHHGQFLQYLASNAITGQSGLLAQLGTSVQWQIRYVETGYVFSPVGDSSKYLAVSESSGSSAVELITVSGEAIPERCVWTMRYAGDGNGCIYQNVYNSRYLTSNGTAISTTASIETVGTELYRSSSWRTASITFYGSTSDFGHRELDSGFSIDRLTLDIGDTSTATIHKSPATATWAFPEDFTYTFSTTDYITVNSLTGEFTAIASGSTHVTATHEVTGLSKQFWVHVNKKAIIILPGIMGSELVAGPNNTKYAAGTELWTKGVINGLEGSAVLNSFLRILSLECNTRGVSVNDVQVKSGGYGFGNTYEKLCTELEDEFGSSYDVIFFGYDWRLSNMESARELNWFIATNQYDKVALVAHSMGGLVASAYLSLDSSKVETLITIGTPFFGTPTIPYVWGTEDVFSILGMGSTLGLFEQFVFDAATFFEDPISNVLSNFDSIYELFPNEFYFDASYGNSSYLNYSALGVENVYTTYDLTTDRLQTYLSSYQAALIRDAEEFHNLLYIGSEHITSLVNTYYISASGKNTVEDLTYNGLTWSAAYSAHGDEMVEDFSANMNWRYADRCMSFPNIRHTDLVKNDGVIEKIITLIRGGLI